MVIILLNFIFWCTKQVSDNGIVLNLGTRPRFHLPGTLGCVFSLHTVWGFQPSLWSTWRPVSWCPPSPPGPLLLPCSLYSVPWTWQASSFCRLCQYGVSCLWITVFLFLLANFLSLYLLFIYFWGRVSHGLGCPQTLPVAQIPLSLPPSVEITGMYYNALFMSCWEPNAWALSPALSSNFFESPLNC